MPAASIRTVNLLWERKFRGIYPPADYSLDETGILTLAVPRPLEPRAYDVTVFRPDGGAEVRWGFSVETLIKLETADSDDCLGMTADDLYLFHNRSKTRFLADKHINYIDCALSADGERLTAAFSDMAGASYALAYGDMSGRLIWLREFDAPLTATAISGDGACVLAADYAGLLTLLDSARKEIWQFELGTPITTVACSRTASYTAYAVDGGRLGLIGMDGSRIWEAALPGEVAALAVSADGALTAALYFPTNAPEGASTVALLLSDGTIGWTHDTDRRATGVSITPDGSVLSVGARDGSVAVYRVEQGVAGGPASFTASFEALARAAQLEAAGDIKAAYQVLQAVGPANPADVALWRELNRTRDLWFAAAMTEAHSLRAANDHRAAIRWCTQIIEADPLYIPAIEDLRALRTERANLLSMEANAHRDVGDLEAAEASLREAVAVAMPENMVIRQALADMCMGQATAMDARAATLISEGRLSEALEALQHAQSISLSTERSERITHLQIQFEFSAGMEAYNARKYSEAAFQFKKVLNLHPGHSEARRYLEFARKFAQDTVQDSLADRFSRLE